MEEDEDGKEKEEQAENKSPFGLSFPYDRAAFAFFLGKSSWQTVEDSEPESEWSVDTIGSTFVNEQTRSG